MFLFFGVKHPSVWLPMNDDDPKIILPHPFLLPFGFCSDKTKRFVRKTLIKGTLFPKSSLLLPSSFPLLPSFLALLIPLFFWRLMSLVLVLIECYE